MSYFITFTQICAFDVWPCQHPPVCNIFGLVPNGALVVLFGSLTAFKRMAFFLLHTLQPSRNRLLEYTVTAARYMIPTSNAFEAIETFLDLVLFYYSALL